MSKFTAGESVAIVNTGDDFEGRTGIVSSNQDSGAYVTFGDPGVSPRFFFGNDELSPAAPVATRDVIKDSGGD